MESNHTKHWILATILVVVVGAAIVLVAYVAVHKQALAPETDQVPMNASDTPKAVTFSCTDGKSIAATFYPDNDTHVDLVLSDGRSLSLPHAMSASGARYANTNESMVFWNKGDTAFMTENGTTTYADCAVPGASATGPISHTTDAVTGVSFDYPNGVSNEYTRFVDWPPKVQVLPESFSCTLGGSETARAGKTEERSIGETAYCVTTESEGAAGSIYTQYAYAFGRGTSTVILTFSIQTPHCENYDEPKRTACMDAQKNLHVDAIVDNIVNSLSMSASGTDPLKNLSFTIDGKAIQLQDGLSEAEAAPGSATKIVTKYFGNEAAGDLNGDGTPDAVFLVTYDGGGSGTFYYVVAALQTDNGYTGTNAVLLGDRIAPQTTEIHNGEITVNYADRASGEPMSARPSVGVSKYLILMNGALTEVKS